MEKTVARKRVLIVDDEVAFLLALRKLLNDPELLVDTTDNYNEAMAFLASQEYSAVISDIRLTGSVPEEGLEILRQVKEKSPETITVVITAYGNPEIMVKSFKLGADYYFEKPVSYRLISDLLREAKAVEY